MARKVFDIGSRFQQAHGFVTDNVGGTLQRTDFADAIVGAEVYLRDTRSSFEEITLRRKSGGADIEYRFGYMGFLEQNPGVFAPPVICTFRHGKRIGETIVSSNTKDGAEVHYGEVVEQYGRKPVAISIRGLLIDMATHKYPGDRVKRLIELFDYNGVWDVEGQIFRDHGIKSIYFTDLESAGLQGYEDTWSFSLEAKSITPVEYFLKRKTKSTIVVHPVETLTAQQAK